MKCIGSIISTFYLSLTCSFISLCAFGCFQITLNALNIWLSMFCCALYLATQIVDTNHSGKNNNKMDWIASIFTFSTHTVHNKQLQKNIEINVVLLLYLFQREKWTVFFPHKQIIENAHYIFYMPLNCKQHINFKHWISC